MTAVGSLGDRAPAPRGADDQPDLRLLPPALAAWGAAAATLSLPAAAAMLTGGLLLATAIGMLVVARRARLAHRGRALVAAAVVTCAAAASLSAAVRVVAVQSGPLPDLAAARASVRLDLTITGDPRRILARPDLPSTRQEQTLLAIPARTITVTARGRSTRVRAPVLVLADQRWAALLPSQRVQVAGRLVPARGPDLSAVVRARGAPLAVTPPSALHRAAGALRAGLTAAVTDLPAAERGLVPGLVVGDTSGMTPDLEADFRATGLTHLTAVSGANVAIVLGVVLGAARWCGLRARAAPVVGALAVAGFVVLARPQPSVLRAAAMGLVALVALGAGRSRRAVPVLAATVVALVLLDPWLARSFGFALSVTATAAILVLAPPWRDALAARLPRVLAAALAVPLAAQAACAPIVVLLSASVSLVAVPANLLVAPAVAPTTVLGVLAAVTAPVAAPVAAVLGRLAGLPATWVVTVAEHGAALPGAVLPWPAGLGGAALLAALTLATVTGVTLVVRSRSQAATAAAAPSPHRRAGVLAAAAALTLLGVSLPAVRGGWPPPGWVMIACAVGQGDALLLAAGGTSAVVVDAGPDPDLADRCLRDAGVRQVPLVMLTHFHADHVDGLAGVVRRRVVGEVSVSPLAEPVDRARAVRRLAARARIPVSVAAVGEQRLLGPLRWRVLWPARVVRAGESAANNASVVLRVDAGGVSLLLAGDVETLAGAAIARSPFAAAVDVLKVAHHGSRLQHPALLAAARPRVALVSVGRGNGYGHPAPPTLAALRAGGALVARTDLDGDIAVVRDPRAPGRVSVVRRGDGAAASALGATPSSRSATGSTIGSTTGPTTGSTIGPTTAAAVPRRTHARGSRRARGAGG